METNLKIEKAEINREDIGYKNLMDVCSEGNNSDHDDMSTSISEDQKHYAINTRQSEFARVSGRQCDEAQ